MVCRRPNPYCLLGAGQRQKQEQILGGWGVTNAVSMAGALALLGASPLALADAVWTGGPINGTDAAYFDAADSKILNVQSQGTPYAVGNERVGAFFDRPNGKTFNMFGDYVIDGGSVATSMRAGTKGTVIYHGDLIYTGQTAATGNSPLLVETQYNQDFQFKGHTSLTGTYNYSGGNTSGGAGMYGVMAGSSVNSGNDPVHNGLYAKAAFNDLTLKLSDTQTRNAVNPSLITGIRSIQGAHNANSGQGSAGLVEIAGKLKADIYADRGIGIYVSGNPSNQGAADQAAANGSITPRVKINNTDITLHQANKTGQATGIFGIGGNVWDSHGIKLGKVRSVGEGAGILVSTGALNIDTTAVEGGGIKMLRNSTLKVDDTNSSTTIKTNGYALQIGGRDDADVQAGSHFVAAAFKDAVFTTTGTSRERDAVGSVARQDLIYVDQGQNGVKLHFSGSQTDLTAHQNGYIINVSQNYTGGGTVYTNTYNSSGTEISGTDALKASSVAFNAAGAGRMTGLVGKNTVKTEQSYKAIDSKKAALNINLSNGFTWNLQAKGTDTIAILDNLTLNNGAVLNGAYGSSGSLNHTISAVVNDNNTGSISAGTVSNNGGIINLANETSATQHYADTLTIDGNYVGNNGYLKVNTEWHAPGDEQGGNARSDLLIIKGDASGTTTVQAIGKNGTPDLIDGSINQLRDARTTAVVQVQGKDNGSDSSTIQLGKDNYTARTTFTGVAKTTGAGEVQLASRINPANGYREYYWTVKAHSGSPILSPVVPAYVLAGQANLEMGYSTLATLHERRSENQVLSWDKLSERHDKQTWGRIFGNHLDLSGKTRMDAEHRMRGIQIGHDFAVQRNDEGGHRLTGIYAAYVHMDSRYSDRQRSVSGTVVADKYTGSGREQGLYLGATHTRYAPEGGYLDLVAQIGWNSNRYTARDATSARQQGWNMTLSAEAGRPYLLNDQSVQEGAWYLEPQAQLVYQMLHLNSFHDGTRQVAGHTHHGLRGRIGARLHYNRQNDQQRSHSIYGIANIVHDFAKGQAVHIGRDSIRENQARTWYELGIGGQWPINRQSHLYADARYEHSFGGTRRVAYRGTLGYKYTW